MKLNELKIVFVAEKECQKYLFFTKQISEIGWIILRNVDMSSFHIVIIVQQIIFSLFLKMEKAHLTQAFLR